LRSNRAQRQLHSALTRTARSPPGASTRSVCAHMKQNGARTRRAGVARECQRRRPRIGRGTRRIQPTGRCHACQPAYRTGKTGF
jgi:hypothetical protein